MRIDGNLHARGNWEKLRFAGAREELLDSWNYRNHLAAPNWPPGAIPEMRGVLIHEKFCFSYFRGTGTARSWVCIARSQAPDSWH